MDQELKLKLAKIKLLAMDFDGVMTDGTVYIDQDGRESVRCSRKDGLGLEMLKKNGLEAVVISKEANLVVSARCKKLKIQCWQKVEDSDGKLEILKKIMEEKGLVPEEVVYMGDDLNDFSVLKYAGVVVTVVDGHQKLKEICDYVTKAGGGRHAVRELCELILESKRIELKF